MYNDGQDIEAAEGRRKHAPRKVKLGSGSFADSAGLENMPTAEVA